MPIKVIFGRPKKVVYSQGGRLEDTLINSAHCAIYGLRSVAAKGRFKDICFGLFDRERKASMEPLSKTAPVARHHAIQWRIGGLGHYSCKPVYNWSPNLRSPPGSHDLQYAPGGAFRCCPSLQASRR
jgi:hypothetical protein